MIRIEREDPLRLLRDLPDGWVQSIITGPPDHADIVDSSFRAWLTCVVGELARVSRADATLLWNIEARQPMPLRRLALAFMLAGGWQQQQSKLASRSGYLLFAKQPQFYWQPQPSLSSSSLLLRGEGFHGRRAWCVPARQDLARQRLERLVLAASTRLACGACGEPWTRRAVQSREGVPLRCGHRNPAGRCLVIDPFQRPGSVLPGLTLSHGRSYLGIQRSLPKVAR